MTVRTLKALIDEVAHSIEDHIHREVLQAIANGHPHYRTLALTTREINFQRYSA